MKCRKSLCRWSSAVVALIISLLTTSGWADSASTAMPRNALKYQRDLTRNARMIWGLNANVPVLAGQIHQESRWRENAQSKYAGGLAQFTPATAEWISGAYQLGAAEPFNPAWALRALVTYDKHLWDRSAGKDGCQRWGFTLASYNGGSGWISKERKLARSAGEDEDVWFGGVERFSARAQWAWQENRDYPRKILFQHQPIYQAWGTTECL